MSSDCRGEDGGRASQGRTPVPEPTKLLVEVYMKDLELIAQHKTNAWNWQKKILEYALLTAGIVVPAVLGAGTALKPELAAVVLLALPVVFWGMSLVYLALGEEVLIAARYIESRSGQLDSLLSTFSSSRCRGPFQWEPNYRAEWRASRSMRSILLVWGVGEIMMIAAPAVGSLLAFVYVVYGLRLCWRPFYPYFLVLDIALIASATVWGILVARHYLVHRRSE